MLKRSSHFSASVHPIGVRSYNMLNVVGTNTALGFGAWKPPRKI